MMHFSCDICSKDMSQTGAERYVLKMEAFAAIARADANVTRLLETIAGTDLKDRTDVVVVSDHGFLPVSQQLQLNFTFKQAGLLDVDASGRIKIGRAHV